MFVTWGRGGAYMGGGRGKIPVCSRRGTPECLDLHAQGSQIKHSSWVNGKRRESWRWRVVAMSVGNNLDSVK